MVTTSPSIDVVVAVYNSPEHVRNCLRSLEHTLRGEAEGVSLILVDDCSNSFTKELLEEFKAETSLSQVKLVRNDKNLGYLKSMNRGIELGSSDLVVSLNSDVVLTDGWHNKVRAGFLSDAKIGVLSAVSNWANWTAIPFPDGLNTAELSNAVENLAGLDSISNIFNASGFFFACRRSLYREYGLFDEVYGPGYYEEADFCMRILEQGYRVVVDRSLYVFHHGWASFGEEQRTVNMIKNKDTFMQRWSEAYDAHHQWWLEQNPVQELRDRLSESRLWRETDLIRQRQAGASDHSAVNRPKVFYLIHAVRLYGGVISIIQIVNELNFNGFDANLLVYGDLDPAVMKLFPTYFRPLVFKDEKDLVENCPDYDLLVATHFPTVDVSYKIDQKKRIKGLKPALSYLVQDFEPDFVKKDDPWHNIIEKNYRRSPSLVCKSDWLRKKLSFYSDSVKVIPLGLNLDCFRLSTTEKKFDVISMVRTSSQRRNFSMLKEVYAQLKELNPKIKLAVYGEEGVEKEFDFEVHNFGKLTEMVAVSQAIASSKVLLDPSTFQGFGRAGLEAMASGTVAVLTREGGIVEYAKHRYNCLLVDPTNREEIVARVNEVLSSPDLQGELIERGSATASRFCHRKEALLVAEYFKTLIEQEAADTWPKLVNF